MHDLDVQCVTNLQVVLSHPVMETYLYLHSKKLSTWLYLSFFLYFLFVVVYTAYEVRRCTAVKNLPALSRNSLEKNVGWAVSRRDF